jgi:hypothetical protein
MTASYSRGATRAYATDSTKNARVIRMNTMSATAPLPTSLPLGAPTSVSRAESPLPSFRNPRTSPNVEAGG